MFTCGECDFCIEEAVASDKKTACNRFPPNFADAAVRLFYLNGIPLVSPDRQACGEFRPKTDGLSQELRLSTNLFEDLVDEEGLKGF